MEKENFSHHDELDCPDFFCVPAYGQVFGFGLENSQWRGAVETENRKIV